MSSIQPTGPLDERHCFADDPLHRQARAVAQAEIDALSTRVECVADRAARCARMGREFMEAARALGLEWRSMRQCVMRADGGMHAGRGDAQTKTVGNDDATTLLPDELIARYYRLPVGDEERATATLLRRFGVIK